MIFASLKEIEDFLIGLDGIIMAEDFPEKIVIKDFEYKDIFKLDPLVCYDLPPVVTTVKKTWIYSSTQYNLNRGKI